MFVRISLTNELSNAGYEYFNGDYEISIMPNGQTSWINGDYAIWYNSGYWLIGSLSSIGQLQGWYMFAINDFYEKTNEENEWNNRDGSSWISPVNPTDIQVTCVKSNG